VGEGVSDEVVEVFCCIWLVVFIFSDCFVVVMVVVVGVLISCMFGEICADFVVLFT